MIHHISIAVKNPKHVADVLAEVFQGVAIPFPAFPDSFVVIAGDEHGTTIEIAPHGMELKPNGSDGAAYPDFNKNASNFTATHAAISVSLSEERIKEIAAREGWRAVTMERGGFFSVVEFWVENTLLLELLPPALAEGYLQFMKPQNLSNVFGLQFSA
jgi:hypothetical protein